MYEGGADRVIGALFYIMSGYGENIDIFEKMLVICAKIVYDYTYIFCGALTAGRKSMG